jgi:hypothetical protein
MRRAVLPCAYPYALLPLHALAGSAALACLPQVDDLRGAVLAVSPDTRAGRIGFKARPPELQPRLAASAVPCMAGGAAA